MEEPCFRIAQDVDLEDIVRIYNQSIECGYITADIEKVSVGQRKKWFEEHNNPRYPLWVIDKDNQIIGWFSILPFYGREAYRKTIEISIYLDNTVVQKGLGKQVVRFIQSYSSEIDVTTILAFIFKANQLSIGCLLSCGFTVWAELPAVAETAAGLQDLCILGYKC